MNPRDIVLDLEPNLPHIPEGIWRARCVDVGYLQYKGDRLGFWWQLTEGPYDLTGQPAWRRGDPWTAAEYDDPTDILIPCYYSVKRVGNRWTAVGSKYKQDLWRYFGKPPRGDRLPSRSLVGCDAIVSVRTVDTDYRGLNRQAYSVVHAILKPAAEGLSNDDLETPIAARG